MIRSTISNSAASPAAGLVAHLNVLSLRGDVYVDPGGLVGAEHPLPAARFPPTARPPSRGSSTRSTPATSASTSRCSRARGPRPPTRAGRSRHIADRGRSTRAGSSRSRSAFPRCSACWPSASGDGAAGRRRELSAPDLGRQRRTPVWPVEQRARHQPSRRISVGRRRRSSTVAASVEASAAPSMSAAKPPRSATATVGPGSRMNNGRRTWTSRPALSRRRRAAPTPVRRSRRGRSRRGRARRSRGTSSPARAARRTRGGAAATGRTRRSRCRRPPSSACRTSPGRAGRGR